MSNLGISPSFRLIGFTGTPVASQDRPVHPSPGPTLLLRFRFTTSLTLRFLDLDVNLEPSSVGRAGH